MHLYSNKVGVAMLILVFVVSSSFQETVNELELFYVNFNLTCNSFFQSVLRLSCTCLQAPDLLALLFLEGISDFYFLFYFITIVTTSLFMANLSILNLYFNSHLSSFLFFSLLFIFSFIRVRNYSQLCIIQLSLWCKINYYTLFIMYDALITVIWYQ